MFRKLSYSAVILHTTLDRRVNSRYVYIIESKGARKESTLPISCTFSEVQPLSKHLAVYRNTRQSGLKWLAQRPRPPPPPLFLSP